jgi:CcmD family protein
MKHYKKMVLFTSAFLMHLFVMAQNPGSTAALKDDGFMRSEGKIYVVMAVVITILVGLILYVFRLDKKITKLEKGDNF